MTRVYIVRHAEAEGNLYRRIHGWYDSRVTSAGLKQLDFLKDRFGNIKLDAVYASDLLRARVTAQAVAYRSQVPIRLNRGLREVNMGIWEDKTWGEILVDQKDQYLYFYSDPEKWNVYGCEPFRELQDRLERTVIDIAGENDGKTIALATHGCAIRSLIARIKGVSSENIREIPYCDNTGISVLEVEGEHIELISHNDASHLPDEYSRFRRQKWRNSRDGTDNSTLWFRANANGDFDVMHESRQIGLLGLDTGRGEADGLGYISCYLLYPEHRGMGLSVQLLGQAVSTYRSLGRSRIAAELDDESAELAGYFRHYGFETVDPHTLCLDISLNQKI